jgi:hypothetical protein
MFGTFYGNSSRSGNSTSSRGMGTRRSRNGQVTIGNGNLVQRAGGPNFMIQCTCPNGTNCGPVSNRGQCRRCCRRAGDPFPTASGSVNSGRRNGGSGFGGGSLRDIDISAKMGRFQKQCFCSAPEGSGLGNQTIICNRLRNCSNCCKSRFGEAWGGQDVIQGVRRRR